MQRIIRENRMQFCSGLSMLSSALVTPSLFWSFGLPEQENPMQSPTPPFISLCNTSPLAHGVRSLEVLPGIQLEMLNICPKEDITVESTLEDDFFELAFVLDGEAEILTVSEQQSSQYTIEPNTCVLVHKTEGTGYFSLLRKIQANMIGISLKAQQLKSMLGVADDVCLDTILSRNECVALSITQKAILHQMFHSPKHGVAWSLYMQGKALELLSDFIEPVVAQLQGSCCKNCDFYLSTEELCGIRLAKNILESNMIDPPSLPELSRLAGLHINKLKRGFHAVYNTTPYACLRKARMLRAGNLLAQGDMNVSQVAWEVGYTNLSHFAAAFLKSYGVNPKVFQMDKATKMIPLLADAQ